MIVHFFLISIGQILEDITPPTEEQVGEVCGGLRY